MQYNGIFDQTTDETNAAPRFSMLFTSNIKSVVYYLSLIHLFLGMINTFQARQMHHQIYVKHIDALIDSKFVYNQQHGNSSDQCTWDRTLSFLESAWCSTVTPTASDKPSTE